MQNGRTEYVIDHSEFPPSCLPSYVSRGSLIDITRVGDLWRRYLDPYSGQEHDGAVYAAEAQGQWPA